MEYESFHYLVHKQVVFKPNYITEQVAKPPTYEELWCTANDPVERHTLKKEEKLFWRSRHRLEFIFEEVRSTASLIVNVREIDTNMVMT